MDFENIFNSEQLIMEVEKRPALYKKELSQYSDKNIKENLWKEVFEAVVPGWTGLSNESRIEIGNDVKKKWKNLRDCFRKELQLQRAVISGQPAKKRKKYVYFEQLLFLVPTLSDRSTSANYSPVANENEPECLDDAGIPDKAGTASAKQQRKNVKKKQTNYEESLLKILQEKKVEEVDEDRNFLISLVPAFRKLEGEQKLILKEEILKCVRRVTYIDHSYSKEDSISFGKFEAVYLDPHEDEDDDEYLSTTNPNKTYFWKQNIE